MWETCYAAVRQERSIRIKKRDFHRNTYISPHDIVQAEWNGRSDIAVMNEIHKNVNVSLCVRQCSLHSTTILWAFFFYSLLIRKANSKKGTCWKKALHLRSLGILFFLHSSILLNALFLLLAISWECLCIQVISLGW